MSRLIPAILSVAACVLVASGCGGNPAGSGDLGLLRVLGVEQLPLELTLGGELRCQVTMDVEVVLPDCTGYGRVGSSVKGNSYWFEVHGSQASFCSGQGVDSFGLCIGPGIDMPGRLPPGDYRVVVNGVTGSFLVR